VLRLERLRNNKSGTSVHVSYSSHLEARRALDNLHGQYLPEEYYSYGEKKMLFVAFARKSGYDCKKIYPSRKKWVGLSPLPEDTKARDLWKLCAPIWHMKRILIVRSSTGNISGFIGMKSGMDAWEVLTTFDEYLMDGASKAAKCKLYDTPQIVESESILDMWVSPSATAAVAARKSLAKSQQPE